MAMDELPPPESPISNNTLIWGVLIALLLLVGASAAAKKFIGRCGDGKCGKFESEKSCTEDCSEMCILKDDSR